MKAFSERWNWCGSCTPKCGWHHPNRVRSYTDIKDKASWTPSFISACFLTRTSADPWVLIRGHFKFIIQLIKPASGIARWVKVLVLKPGDQCSIFRTHLVRSGQPTPASCPLTLYIILWHAHICTLTWLWERAIYFHFGLWFIHTTCKNIFKQL